jgi:DNA modification methylase
VIPATLEQLSFPMNKLRTYHHNPRVGDVEAIMESLRVSGQYRPIVVNRQSMEILAGNHTFMAAERLGWDVIAATFVDVEPDSDAEKRIVAVDNRSADLGHYDEELLAELLQSMDDLTGSGYNNDQLDELLLSLQPSGFNNADKDAAPPLSEVAVTQLGDVIDFGPHRLVCGDALDPKVIEAALSSHPADLVVTDPPYTVQYDSGRRLTGDELTGDEAAFFLHNAMQACAEALRPGGVYYVFSPSGPPELRFRQALEDANLGVRQGMVWVKDSAPLGRSDYHWRHETILYGWKPGVGHYWGGDHTLTSVWECDRPKASKEHPTMKPVALLEQAVLNSSKPGELVLDPFAGSGSTLIACAAMGRRCALVEIDPLYADVIVERWQRLTGEMVR